MSKAARNPVELTDEARKKLEERMAAMALCGFGPKAG
jgi:hypothetical protein